ERVDALVEAGIPLHRDVDFVVVARVGERNHPLEQRLLRRVEVLHEVEDPPGEAERLVENRFDALVAERDLETLVEERHLAHAPAIASSTELSTTSYTRWCRPVIPVEPMYMPGRSRTGSRPLSTVMSLAAYATRAHLANGRGKRG